MNEPEVWLPVVGFEEQYLVSSLGRIKSMRLDRLLKVSGRADGYVAVALRRGRDGVFSRINVHTIVAQAFLGAGLQRCNWCDEEGEWATGNGPKRPGLRVDHLDRVHQNNAAYNLVPACNRCNTSRSRLDRIMPGELFVRSSTVHARVTRAEKRICEECGDEFLWMIAKRDPKKGRFCSKSCSNKWRWKHGNIGSHRIA